MARMSHWGGGTCGQGVTARSLPGDGRASLADAHRPRWGHAGLPASQPCARPVAEDEISMLSGVQEEFLPRLVPASPPPTFTPCGKPSRKLTHCLLPPRLGAGPCCLQHWRAAPFTDAGIAHRPDPPAPARPGSSLPEPSSLPISRGEQPWHPDFCAICSWAGGRAGSLPGCQYRC